MAAGSRDARLLVLNLLALLLILVFLPLHYLGVESAVYSSFTNSDGNFDCGSLLHPNPRPNELIDADEFNARLYPKLVSGRPTLVVLCHDALIRERSYVIAACVPASLILVLIVVLTVRLRVAARRRETQSRLLFLPNRVAIPAICILIVLSMLWLGALSL